MTNYYQASSDFAYIDTVPLDDPGSERRKTGADDQTQTTIEFAFDSVIHAGEETSMHEDRVLEIIHISQPDAAPGNSSRSEEAEQAVKATILLPAYNEELALPEVLKSLLAVVDDSYEIIIVDDGSSDNTSAVAREFPCRLITHRQNQGKGAALRTGLSAARGEFVIVMDADNTYPAEAIPDMVALLEDRDFVRGIRRLAATNTPRVNRIGNKIIDSALKMVYGLEGTDHLSGLYGLRRDVFNSMQFTADGFDVEVEIGIKASAHKLRSGMLPIDYHERLGEKKLRPLQDGWRILHRMLSLALLYNPTRIFLAPGLCLWALAAVFTVLLGLRPSETSYIGLNTQAFIVAALGVPAGFQLIVFGITAALYGIERHIPPRDWLLTLGRARIRFWAGMFGSALLLAGVVMLLFAGARWMSGGETADLATRNLVLALVFLLWGFQTILAVLFVSIFAGRLDKVAPLEAERSKKSYPIAVTLNETAEAE